MQKVDPAIKFKDKKNEYILLSQLVAIRIGSGAFLPGLVKKTALASRWILGGAIAFLYSILSDPEKALKAYGAAVAIMALILFLVSFVSGIVFAVYAAFQAIMEESKTIQAVTKNHLELKELLSEKEDLVKERVDIEEGTALVGKYVGQLLVLYFKRSQAFLLQVFSFTIGAVTLVASFVWRALF